MKLVPNTRGDVEAAVAQVTAPVVVPVKATKKPKYEEHADRLLAMLGVDPETVR